MNKEEAAKLEISDLVRFELADFSNRNPFNWGGVSRSYDIGIVIDKYWCKVEKDYMVEIEWMSDDENSYWWANDEGYEHEWQFATLLNSSEFNEQA